MAGFDKIDPANLRLSAMRALARESAPRVMTAK
jgi:hypothetical protein